MQGFCLRALSVSICILIAIQPAIAGQSGISILIVEGNRAQNMLSEQAPKPISVRVVDGAGRPLENANVQFFPPEFGPGGEFVTTSNPIMVNTNPQGLAVAPPFMANATEGIYEIQIVASYMGQVTRLLLEQSNVTKKKAGNKKLFIISALVGGAAAAAFAAKGGGSDPAPNRTPPGVTTAPPIVFLNSTVGPPQ
jgi:hypothetical protein